MRPRTGLMLLLIANVLCYCVLTFYQTGLAQMSAPRPTLSDPAEERRELIANLEAIKALLKEQNALLRSGDVKVIVTELPKK
jgi:hypothetical protein